MKTRLFSFATVFFFVAGSSLPVAASSSPVEKSPEKLTCQQFLQLANQKDPKRQLKNKVIQCDAMVLGVQDSSATLPVKLQRYHNWIKKLGDMHLIELQVAQNKTHQLYLLTANPDTIEILAKGSRVSFSAQILFDALFQGASAQVVLHNEELSYDVMNK